MLISHKWDIRATTKIQMEIQLQEDKFGKIYLKITLITNVMQYLFRKLEFFIFLRALNEEIRNDVFKEYINNHDIEINTFEIEKFENVKQYNIF